MHKVIARTDVYLGEDPFGEPLWIETEKTVALHDDHMVDLILGNWGEEREDVPVQQIVCPAFEDQIHVIEIHYNAGIDFDHFQRLTEQIVDDADYKIIESPDTVTYYRGRDQYTISRQEEILIVDGFEYRA